MRPWVFISRGDGYPAQRLVRIGDGAFRARDSRSLTCSPIHSQPTSHPGLVSVQTAGFLWPQCCSCLLRELDTGQWHCGEPQRMTREQWRHNSVCSGLETYINVYICWDPSGSVYLSLVQSLSHVWLCNPMDCTTPGLPVHHQLPDFTQTHVHWVRDAIQPSHPLSSPSPPTFNLSQHQGLFKRANSSYEAATVLEFQLQCQSFQWTPGPDLLQVGLVGSPCSPRDSQESSPTPQFKSINSSTVRFLCGPTLTSIHDHWKNHRLD